MLTTILTDLGLTPEQQEIYESLLENGPQPATQLATTTTVKRTYVYTVCNELLERGLITQEKAGSATIFIPEPPEKLLKLAQTQREQLQQAEESLSAILPTLSSKYQLVANKPVVTYYEGIEGLKKVYQQLLNDKQDLLLFRSIYDDKKPEIDDVVMKHLQKQVAAGIHTRTITPLEPTTKEIFLKYDKARLVERHIVTSTTFALPAQILVFGTKLALISLKKNIVITLIDNQDISDAFKGLFEFMWALSAEEHQQIISEWTTEVTE
jgi:sugar-specific transcriptional regulator TrmB